ncbi:MAG: MFS transporter [Pirellulales bacterium]|nr:MFS transporter [Pirellulales bacterium]
MNQPTTARDDHLGDRLMRLIWWRKPSADLAERIRRRVTVHLIPYLFFLYILAYLDRVNVSVAQLGMELPASEQGLGFTRSTIGFGAGLFFWGYWILEIPSTLSVVRWGARWVFVRILVLWGVCATLVGFIGLPIAAKVFGWFSFLPGQFFDELPTNAKYQFYFLRFMLGFFEGGFLPSVIMYLSLWFRSQDRAKAIALFMAAIPLSSAIGLPLSGLLLGVHWLGMPGWRWIFIIEGILPIFAGITTLFFLPDRPEKAKWLTPQEKDWLSNEFDAEHQSKQGHGHWAWLHHLGIVLLLTAVYFGQNVMGYGLSMFMPAIIKSQSGVTSQVASFLATVPFALAFIGILFNGWHSDRTRERFWHVAASLAMTSIGLYLAAALDSVPLAAVTVMMLMVGFCMYAHLPAFWPIVTIYLGAAAAASAIGFINMVGNLGGFVGPNIVGTSVDEDIRWVSSLMETQDTAPLSRDNSEKIDKLAEAISASRKLSLDENRQLSELLGQVKKGEAFDRETQSQLVGLLNRGASFSDALRHLAPWPMMSAIIILIVGYVHRKTARKRAAIAQISP